VKEDAMYRKILVGYDDSDQSKDALVLGKQLADATGAHLLVAGVFQFDPIWGDYDPHFHEQEAEYARKIEAAAKSVGAEPEAFPSSSPARGLHELAEEIAADLILVGSAHHGRVGQAVAGSVGVALLHGSPCAVGVASGGYRERSGQDLGAIAVGVDGSDEARVALAAACELASRTGAKLRLVAVAEPPVVGTGKGGAEGWHELNQAIEQMMRERLTEARDSVPEGIEVDRSLVSGDPAKALIDAAAGPGSLLMVGSRGYGPLRRVLLGSVSTRLVRLALCPLIVTPRGTLAGDDAASRASVKATS
jgi:nucleotide-binding universal stress UspA family protein